jgi:streptogramin lyase
LSQPFGICIGQTGEFFVTDTGCSAVLGIDPQTGNQRVVACNSILGSPFGIAAEAGGTIVIANAQALLRINPQTGAQAILASGGLMRVPLAVAVGENGSVFVVDALGSIIEVNPRSGAQTLVTSGGYLQRPQGLAVHGKDIYVTDVATADGNFGVGRIVHIDSHTGEQSVLAEGGYLVGPVGITMEQNGNLIVSDPYTINEASADLFDGGIIELDSKSGHQTLIARGKDGFVNPRCVAVVRTGQ